MFVLGMENLALVSSPSPILGYSFQNPRYVSDRHFHFGVSLLWRTNRSAPFKPRYFTVSASAGSNAPGATPNSERLMDKCASISSSSGETSSVIANPQLSLPPPSPHVGSPLFWIGVGVGLSALFSIVATNVKKYAMQQVFKTLMGGSQNNQFDASAFSSGGSQFPFPAASDFGSTSSVTSQPVATVDIPVTKVEASSASTDVKDPINMDVQAINEQKKYAFVDVSPEETSLRSPFESEVQSETSSSKNGQFLQSVSPNGALFKQVIGDSESKRKSNSGLSVEALEKMMEDPAVQKMVYPYLPEEMRNPTTFKWMLQNPQYRKQLEDMLSNMTGSGKWDNQMTDTLKKFDFSSPEIQQQFDQIGLTPEQVITKIMANPEVAAAFQNPRVQAAIMDCSQNPLSIAKYQNDKEVMDVFNKISELFPGVAGPPT